MRDTQWETLNERHWSTINFDNNLGKQMVFIWDKNLTSAPTTKGAEKEFHHCRQEPETYIYKEAMD